MEALRKIGRALRRFNRRTERAAIAASAIHGEGMGGTQVSAIGVKTALSEIEDMERQEAEPEDADG